MICEICTIAADAAEDYRKAAAKRPASWLGIRLRRAGALHKRCKAPQTCTCQHRVCA